MTRIINKEAGVGRYILHRLLALIPVVIGVTFLIFCVVDMAPGDAISYKYADSG